MSPNARVGVGLDTLILAQTSDSRCRYTGRTHTQALLRLCGRRVVGPGRADVSTQSGGMPAIVLPPPVRGTESVAVAEWSRRWFRRGLRASRRRPRQHGRGRPGHAKQQARHADAVAAVAAVAAVVDVGAGAVARSVTSTRSASVPTCSQTWSWMRPRTPIFQAMHSDRVAEMLLEPTQRALEGVDAVLGVAGG
jgi:hypothetical protein